MSDRERCLECALLGKNNVCGQPVPDWACPPNIVDPFVMRTCPTFTPVTLSKVGGRVRMTRILIYEGTAEWVNSCLRNRGVKGSQSLDNGIIKEAIIGDFMEEIK